MTSKGQLTVPAEVRRDLGLRTGSKVEFVKVAPGVYEMIPKTRSIRDLRGVVRWDGPPVTLEEMDAAIAEGAAETMRR